MRMILVIYIMCSLAAFMSCLDTIWLRAKRHGRNHTKPAKIAASLVMLLLCMIPLTWYYAMQTVEKVML